MKLKDKEKFIGVASLGLIHLWDIEGLMGVVDK